MIVIQVRDLINGTCGSPILCPNEFIARRQTGRIIYEHALLKEHPDKVKLDIISGWDETDGMIGSDLRVTIPGEQCLKEYEDALEPWNKPGEGEFISEDVSK